MSKKQLPLFATANDLSALLREVCAVMPVELAVMGLFDEAEPSVLADPLLIQPLTPYLAVKRGIRVVSRSVQQHRGGIKFAVDPIANPRSVVLRCGGRIGAERLTAGDVSVATDDEEAEELFAKFSNVILRQFQKIKSYYVGPDAVRLLDEGIRLSPTTKFPPEYDLTR
jgi:hypothetical protein